MANRCVRCQKEDITLETFGVFRCPACGRVDADGRALDAGPVGAASEEAFAAPPPWIPLDVAERAREGLVGSEARPAPTWLFGAVIVTAIVALASAASTGAWSPAAIQLAMLGALATGRPWARVLSIALDLLSIVVVCVVLVLLRDRLPPFLTRTLLVHSLLDAAWIYVLFREDTVRYFART